MISAKHLVILDKQAYTANFSFHDSINPSAYHTYRQRPTSLDKTYQAWLVQDQPAPHSFSRFSNPPSKRIEHHLVSDTSNPCHRQSVVYLHSSSPRGDNSINVTSKTIIENRTSPNRVPGTSRVRLELATLYHLLTPVCKDEHLDSIRSEVHPLIYCCSSLES
jgi:hypothetical protein